MDHEDEGADLESELIEACQHARRALQMLSACAPAGSWDYWGKPALARLEDALARAES